SIKILIYWFVCGALRERAPVEVNGMGIPFFIWLLAGFFLWIFAFQSMIEGYNSIYSRLRILSKMRFHFIVILNLFIYCNVYILFNLFFIFFMFGIIIIILQFTGFYISIHYIQLIYFLFSAIALLFAFSLITSTISTIIRDFHMFLNSTLRMLLYLSGVLWPITILSDFPIIMKIMQLNPLYYLIEGYRAALLGKEWYIVTHWELGLYFWGLVLVLMIIGSKLHVKFRNHLIDYL